MRVVLLKNGVIVKATRTEAVNGTNGMIVGTNEHDHRRFTMPLDRVGIFPTAVACTPRRRGCTDALRG